MEYFYTKRFIVMRTDNGFMPFDAQEDDYLHDEKGNNCFDTMEEAKALIKKMEAAE
jgi:hypothetical protein